MIRANLRRWYAQGLQLGKDKLINLVVYLNCGERRWQRLRDGDTNGVESAHEAHDDRHLAIVVRLDLPATVNRGYRLVGGRVDSVAGYVFLVPSVKTAVTESCLVSPFCSACSLGRTAMERSSGCLSSPQDAP